MGTPLRRCATACAIGLLLLIHGCAGPGAGTATGSSVLEITGTATYRERMALPQGATLTVTAEDVSRADAPAIIIGRTETSPNVAPLIPFQLTVPASALQPGHRYALRARIEHAGQMLFTTDTHHAMPQDGTPAALMLVRIGAGTSTAQLENTYWKLLQLGDEQVVVAEQQREPHLILQAPGDSGRRVAGFAGCNRMTGSYTVDGDRLVFTQMAGTLMACTVGMDTEQAFHAMLQKVARWRIRGEQLELFDAQGTRLALLESRYLR